MNKLFMILSVFLLINKCRTECLCCNRLSGRYCGSNLNNDNQCKYNNNCASNVIYWCETTYNYSRPVRICDSRKGPCLQVDIGSARCQN